MRVLVKKMPGDGNPQDNSPGRGCWWQGRDPPGSWVSQSLVPAIKTRRSFCTTFLAKMPPARFSTPKGKRSDS